MISSTSQPKVLSDEDYLQIFNNMMNTCEDREDCWFGAYPTLKELNQKNGVKAGQGIIATYLYLLNFATNHKVKLSDAQVRVISETVYSKFFYLKETEIMLFFHDYFLYLNSDKFFGSIEFKTIMDMFTIFVREKRGTAICRHDELLVQQRKEEEKPYLMPWEEFCQENRNNSSDSPKDRILSAFGKREVPQDSKESIAESALSLIENKWNYDDDTMMDARRSFVCRYGYTPEDFLRKEGKDV